MSDADDKIKQLKQASWYKEKAFYDLNARQDFSVQILPDKTIGHGMFRQHTQNPNTYMAHPTTIKALKKDIFLAGSSFEEFEEIIQCESCKKELDKQFWHFCPFCESQF